MFFTKISSIHAIKYPYLVNLSIITSIALYTYPMTRSINFSNLIIKSHDTTSYSLPSVLTSRISLYSLYLLNLFLWQSRHSLVTSLARFHTFLIIYSYCSLITGAVALLYPCIIPLWNSIINSFATSSRIYVVSLPLYSS